jgi:hypothetical protein
MPNDCYNKLTIIGHEEDLNEIYMSGLNFDYYIPTPEDIQDPAKWRTENWGTKWAAYPESIKMNFRENFLRITYTTAWSPPYIFLEQLLEFYPRCWIKNESVDENSFSLIYIIYMKDGVRQEKIFHWYEPEPRLTADGQILIIDDE